MKGQQEFFSLTDATKIMGVTRAALMYRIRGNGDGIREHIYTKETKTRQGKPIKKYFLSAEYVSTRSEVSDDEREKMETLYYSAYSHIENILILNKMLKEGKNILANSNIIEKNMKDIFLQHFPEESSTFSLETELVNFSFKTKRNNVEIAKLFDYILKEWSI